MRSCKVFFLPVAVDLYTGDDEVPRHPALRMLANSEQFLTSRYRCCSFLLNNLPSGVGRQFQSVHVLRSCSGHNLNDRLCDDELPLLIDVGCRHLQSAAHHDGEGAAV